MLLAHNHMMLVLRAYMTRTKRNLPRDAERDIVFCEPESRLSKAAVAESPIGKQLAELLDEGCEVEVLAWERTSRSQGWPP